MSKFDLTKALHDGTEAESLFGKVTLRSHDLGDLIASSGRIVACDPLVFPETQPFATTIAPGHYPVIASVAEFANGDRRVAYTVLRVSEQTPVQWEMATCPGEDLSTLKEGDIFGYPVDAGTGCFMDWDAQQALLLKMDEDEDYGETIIDGLHKTRVHTWAWVNKTLDPTTGANLVAFSSGLGDGFYASYWGYDADRNIACLITDFGILD